MTAPRLQNSAPAGPQQRRAERRMSRQGPPRWGTMEGGGKGRLSRCAGTPSRLGTPSSLGKASRVAGGPGCHHLQGHVACAGHHRRAPHVGQAARGWSRAGLRGAGPDPAGGRRGPALSQLGVREVWGFQTPQPDSGRSMRPCDPHPPGQDH